MEKKANSIAVVALYKIREIFLLEEENGLLSLPEKMGDWKNPFYIEKFMTSVLGETSKLLYAVSPFERVDGHYVMVLKMHCWEKYKPIKKGLWVQVKNLKPENLKDGYKSYCSILSAMPYYKYQLTVNDWAKTPKEDLENLKQQISSNKGSIFWEDMLVRYSLKMDDTTIKTGIKLILSEISINIPLYGELFYDILLSTIKSIGSLIELEMFIRWGREHEKDLKKLTMKEIKPYRKAFTLLDLSLKKGILKLNVAKKPDLKDPRFDLDETQESLGITDEFVMKTIKQRSLAIEATLKTTPPFVSKFK